ncbi:MAG TPA: serine hydrolase [Steroidobacteraceae bacterium]|nr:serine hydrolase [Steroidobacteraceae bacterium]
MRRILLLIGFMAWGAQAAGLPADADVRSILEQHVQSMAGPEGGMGIVVGLLDEKGPRIVAYGDTGGAAPRPLNGDTVFEIASVSKVFTALLLAEMVRTGDLSLTDPAAKHLRNTDGLSMTLADLATHTAGLPFMPDNAPVLSPDARYSKSDLYAFIASRPASADVGSAWAYSNLDYWLLQEVISARANEDFRHVMQSRVLTPLGLRSTAATWSPDLKARAAVGHDAALQPAPQIASLPVFDLMPASGGMVSTANDLLKFLSQVIGYEQAKLAPSMAALLQTRRPAGGHEQALGWWIVGAGEDSIVFHDGGSFGFSSSLAWQPQRRVGVVVLANQATAAAGIARHLLQPSVPLAKPKRARRTQITLEAAILDRYVGRYDIEDEGVVVIGRDGALLTIELPDSWGLPKLKLHAEKDREFFATLLPLQATFEVDASGRVTRMLVQPPRGQRPIPARRL